LAKADPAFLGAAEFGGRVCSMAVLWWLIAVYDFVGLVAYELGVFLYSMCGLAADESECHCDQSSE
jgi:hypothetical protein